MIDYLNIGLDFGTHQSKVCIEDTSDPRNRTYTFFKFLSPDGKKTFFLPSVVQINTDNTLSYGFVDESKALVLGYVHTFSEPKFVKPKKPELIPIPSQPPVIRIATKDEYLATLSEKGRYKKLIFFEKGKDGKKVKKTVIKDVGPERYVKYYSEMDIRNRVARVKWEQDCSYKKKMNALTLENYEAVCKVAEEEFNKKHSFWENSLVEQKAIYRYFKIATFSKDSKWKGDISPKLLSTWFLTYMFFCLFEEYPDEVSFQMGIPESIGEKYSATQKRNAEDIFYTAYKLYKYFKSKEAFLKTSVDFLKIVTSFSPKNIDYSTGSQVLVLPEAYAGLLTITQQGKIGIGMNLLVDIGGGSTDISLFNVISNRSGSIPNISRIISIHRGLNYIYSLYKESHYEMSLEEIRKLFAKNPSAFRNEIETYRRELASLVQDEFYTPLYMAALRQGISKERLLDMLENRPVIYSGGGGVFEVFHKSIHVFSEPISVSKDLLSLKNVSDRRITDDELSILSVAYGLSIPQVKEPEMTPLEQLFSHIHLEKSTRANTNGYEHGLSDID